MSAHELFNRSWSVKVGVPGDLAYEYTQLRTVFQIEKTSASSSNKATVQLYNLNLQSRMAMQKKGLQLQLKAGYFGLIESLYLGDVMKVEIKRDHELIVTTFECGECEKQLANAHFEKSYPPGTTYVQIVQDLAAALGVDIGVVLGIQAMSYNTGVSFSGSCKHVLDRLLLRQGLEWSIQNNALQILPRSAHNGEEAIVLSKKTGLIGVPSPKESGILFSALLNPKLMPGQAVKIVSDTFNGFYKIKMAKFSGDSHGDKWQVECEGVRINATQSLAQNKGGKFQVTG